jgi:hypothetical protein
MLRVTVALWPGGRESGCRTLATADIGRVKSGAIADYQVELRDEILGDIGTAIVREYPRYAAPVWDLVARGIAIALAGEERLPTRPQLPDVPIHQSGNNTPFVRIREIPEPARTLFRKNMRFSTRPVIEDDAEPMDCAYAWDWDAFLAGTR